MGRLKDDFKTAVKSYGIPMAEELIATLEQTEPSIAIRLNPRKTEVFASNDGQCEESGKETSGYVPWCNTGRYLAERPAFTFDPAMHQGRYYVQDASSMIITEVIRQITDGETPVRYLDSCAAPGGKTTAAIDALPEGSLVVANEFDFRRAEILRENIIKWGYPATVVSRGDTARFRKLPGWFDIVAADVPCSGEGMMRKDPKAAEQWSRNLINECAARQHEILNNLWTTLRPGGFLIYSTCTFNSDENEQILQMLVKEKAAEPVRLAIPQEWGICNGIGTDIPCLRFLPHKLKGEGLFLGVVRKPADDERESYSSSGFQPSRRDRKNKKDTGNRAKNNSIAGIRELSSWLTDSQLFDIAVRGDNSTVAFPSKWKREFEELAATLDIIHSGIELATAKGRDLIPSQSLALSTALKTGSFPTVEVDRATALTYLRRDTVTLPDANPDGSPIPRGFVLLTFEEHPLGFVKNIGNRTNNLYPAQWRILSRQPQQP